MKNQELSNFTEELRIWNSFETEEHSLNDNRITEKAKASRDRAIMHAYNYLKKMAIGKTKRERNISLQPTELANMAIIKLDNDIRKYCGKIENRGFFYYAAGRAMRQLIIEHSLKKKSLSNNRVKNQTLEESLIPVQEGIDNTKILLVDKIINELKRINERHYKVIFFKYWIGLKSDEIADALGIGKSTVERDFSIAKKWLRHRLKDAI